MVVGLESIPAAIAPIWNKKETDADCGHPSLL